MMNSQWSQSQSPNPHGPVACHAHSLIAARCWLHVPKSEMIWKIYTQGLHTPQTQMYRIPITTDVFSGKHQSQSVPTLPSTWAHCHAHSLRAAARCQLHVPTSVIIIWKIHTQGLHTPTPPTHTLPITTEVLSGKHQSQYAPPSAPTLSSTWAHCHAHALSTSWPHLDHRQASAYRSSMHHRRQCATMLPRRSSRDCNNFPGFWHHVGDVNQAQCQRAYTRHNSWVSMVADELCMHLLLCQRSIQSFSTHHYTNISHMYSHH